MRILHHFDNDMETEWQLVFHELATDACRRRGRFGLWLLWCRVLVDLGASSPREHFARWTKRGGGTAVDIRTVLARRLTSDETDRRWGRALVLVMAFLIPIPIVRKFATMHLTTTQWMLGGMATGLLTLQISSYGLLLSLKMGSRWSRLRHNVFQIAIYTTLGLAFILGVWRLRSITTSEFEFMLGFSLLSDVVMGAMSLGTFLGIIRSTKAKHDEPTIVKE